MPGWPNTGGIRRITRSPASGSAASGRGGGFAGAWGPSTRARWRAARRGRLYSRGDAAKGGNRELRIAFDEEGGCTLAAAISHLGEKTGHRTYARAGKVQERDTYSEASRVTGRLGVPRKCAALMGDLVLSGRPSTVEVLQGADGHWRAHVRFAVTGADAGGMDRGVVGLDPKVAMAHVGRDGTPPPWPEGLAARLRAGAAARLRKYSGAVRVGVAPGRIRLHAPTMWSADADRRPGRVGVGAKRVVWPCASR